jgi:flagellar motor switch protein FliG
MTNDELGWEFLVEYYPHSTLHSPLSTMVAPSIKITEEGLRKAAILVANLDRVAADAVLELLSPDQAKQVRYQVLSMDEIADAELEEVLEEFADMRAPKPARAASGVELAGRLAQEVGLGAEVDDESDEYETSGGLPFQRLREAEGEKIARILAGERPQTIALVLSHLPPHQAGGVLVRFPADQQVEIVRRLVDLEETDPVILREVEKALESRLSRQVQMQRRRVVGMDAVSGILEASSGDVSMKILDNLAAGDRNLARKFGPEPFDFENLERMDAAFQASVIRSADPAWLMPALLGASPRLIERALGSLPYEEAEQLHRQLSNPGPIRLSDVEIARRRIGETAGRLLYRNKQRRAYAA